MKLGGDQLVPYYADILGAILPCISDKEEKIRVVSILSYNCCTLLYSLLMPPFLFDACACSSFCIFILLFNYSLLSLIRLHVKQMKNFEELRLIQPRDLMWEQSSPLLWGMKLKKEYSFWYFEIVFPWRCIYYQKPKRLYRSGFHDVCYLDFL